MPANRVIRTTKGASLALVAVCAIAIVLLIIGCFQMAMLIGGGQDARNAIDAGALNVSKRVFEVKTQPTPDFVDCADTAGAIGLTNINRVWSKTLLETANDIGMNNENLGTNVAKQNIDIAFEHAQQINDALYGTLADARSLASFFEDITSSRSVQTPNSSATMVAEKTNAWETARVDRGAESNISFSQKQFPPAANVALSSTSIAGNTMINGYTPFKVGDKQFYFVSFRAKEMPHLIAQSYFEQNRTDKVGIDGIVNALPNAFAVHGLTNDTGTFGATAYAVANPQRNYFLAIPHAFVSVRIANIARWYVNGKKVNETTYGLAPETQWGAKQVPLACGGKLNGYASLGNEYKGQLTLLQALQFLQGDVTPALTRMVQRLQEVDPLFDQTRLESFLSSQMVSPASATYIIYPLYQTQDATWPNLTMQIAPSGRQKSAWLLPGNRPEGSVITVVNQNGVTDSPNTDWQMIAGGNCAAGEHWTFMTGQLNWQPGTGYDQSLGELSINHITNCYFNAN